MNNFLTIYEKEPGPAFSDNAEILLEKKGRIFRVIVAALSVEKSGGMIFTGPFKAYQPFQLANGRAATIERALCFLREESKQIFERFTAARKEIEAQRAAGPACAAFVNFVNEGLNK